MARRTPLGPIEVELDKLGPRGVAIGLAPDGRPVHVRGAPPGARVLVQPQGRRKGVYQARRLAMVRPPAASAAPDCPQFGTCGGCTLQELGLGAQRAAKWQLGVAEVEAGLGQSLVALGVSLHGVRGTLSAYGYRNKVELSFGVRRYLSEAAHAADEPIDGRFLGFHAPGRFDRVVDAPACSLVSDGTNALLAVARALTLGESAPPPWDVRTHTGFWRHLVLRRGERTGEHHAWLITASASSPEQRAAAEALLDALLAAELPAGERCVGAVWAENDGVADVARGVTAAVRGAPVFHEALVARDGRRTTFTLSPGAFFQTNTAGAEQLYEVVGEALGPAADTLLDLYCGAGSIGLFLADRVRRVIGVEAVEAAVGDARANAAANGVTHATYTAAKVEDALDVLGASGAGVVVVVDPPRAGLHPKVAKALATHAADALVYVACHPASLGRDGALLLAGGWRMVSLWAVDLFPQTGHVELVARFVRDAP